MTYLGWEVGRVGGGRTVRVLSVEEEEENEDFFHAEDFDRNRKYGIDQPSQLKNSPIIASYITWPVLTYKSLVN